jgi:hypothetical protein
VTGTLPPHWPDPVRPPGTADWEATAVAWLLDVVPGEYRAYDVLRRHPILLARFAAGHADASLEAARRGWRNLRRDLGRDLTPEVMEAAMAAYEREGARLADLCRQIDLVDAALHGRRWTARL